ncbi:hypothetical protein B0T20DRAFT_388260 [Sordaria brevicollis]|uniref:Uncharacterized protein n=1 Tax=Sordaria brevicollis TaxID=83679 RepID=A0AAE0PMD6_SORBR|nr:hypothetical protein B0T20DRAFT_388260 [Sordaria brevicollis]
MASLLRRLAGFTFKLAVIPITIAETVAAPLREATMTVAATAMKWLSAVLGLPALPVPFVREALTAAPGSGLPGATLENPAAAARRFGPSLPEGSREGDVFRRERERMRLGMTPVYE